MASGLLLASTDSSAACLSSSELLQQVDEWVEVSQVIDGDTVHLKDGRKIRLIGVNTPELGRKGKASEPYALAAYQFVKNTIEANRKVGLSHDQERKDRYNRVLAYLILEDGRSLQQLLLRHGLAVSIAVEPNVSRLGCMRQIESAARTSAAGLWQLPEMQVIKADKLSAKARGYRFVSGKVKKVSKYKHRTYLQLSPTLSVRIKKKDLQQLAIKPKSLKNKQIIVRGWLNPFKKRQTINLSTQENLQIFD
jgi:endonuclease YncB( thermonuclease family)